MKPAIECDAAQACGANSEERPEGADEPGSYRLAKAHVMATWERAFVADLIRRNQGNLSRAAREARMDRNHLRTLLYRYGISYTGGRNG